MTNKKVTDLDVTTSANSVDLLYIVTNPETTPSSNSISFADLIKSSTNLTEEVSSDLDDEFPFVDDPNGTPAGKKIKLSNMIKITQTSALSSDHSHTARDVYQFTANEAQNFGDICYIDSAGEMALADADAASTSLIAGMCVSSSVSADATGDYIIDDCIVRDDSWDWTVGGIIYVSTTGTTGNTLTQTAPSETDDVVMPVGIATHADRMIFRPSMTLAVVS